MNWISTAWSGRLTVSPRPRGGDWLEDDIKAWREAGATVVVSLLEQQENADLALDDEQTLASKVGLEFISFPMVDRGAPESREETMLLIRRLQAKLEAGSKILIHCRQGIGRSGLMAVALLIIEGVRLDDAIQLVSAARGLPVPETQLQLDWLKSFAGRLSEQG